MLHEDNRSGRRRSGFRRLAPIAAICVTGILAAACQSSSGGGSDGGGTSGHSSPPANTVQLSITPASGSTGRQPAQGHHGHLDQGHDQVGRSHRRRAHRTASRHGHAEQLEDGLAHRLDAARGPDPHGHRHSRRLGPLGHPDQHVQDAPAVADLRHPPLRGLQGSVRGRHADHADLQPAHQEQGRSRALAADHHVQAGRGGLVLGQQPDPVVPPARLLASAHPGQLRRAPGRCRGLPRRLR